MSLMRTLYDSKRWNNLRKRILVRDKYIDRYQMRYGKYRNADVVHHIFPANEYPQYFFCEWNLISISQATHNKFHDRINDELTEIGMDVLRRTCKKRNMPIPDKYKENIKKGYRQKYDRLY